MNISISNEARKKTRGCLFSSYFHKTAYEPYVSLADQLHSPQNRRISSTKKIAPYARSRTTRGSAGFSPQRQHFSGDSLRERQGVSPDERRVGGARPRQLAGAGSALRPPVPSRRLGGVTSRGVSGTYVTPRGRRRCCFSPFPKANSFPRPPQLPQCPGTSQRPPPQLPSPGASRPAASLPAGGTRHCPSPAAGQRSPAPPPAGELLPPQGSPRFPTWPRESGRSPGGEEFRDGKFPSRSPAGPDPSRSPAARDAVGRRCSPGTPRSGRRLPRSPHGRGHTPRAGGRAPGHRPAGRGRRHLGREGIAPQPRAAQRAALSREGGPGRLIPTHEWHLLEEGYARHETCLVGFFFLKRQDVSILCGRSRVCARSRGSKYTPPEVIPDGHVFKHLSLHSTEKGSSMLQSEELLVSLEKLWQVCQKGSHQKHCQHKEPLPPSVSEFFVCTYRVIQSSIFQT